MIHDTRVSRLNAHAVASTGQYVLLWVQASVRVTDNHALEYAIREANTRRLPVVAVFGLTPSYPDANARHYRYLLEGLRDLRAALGARGIPLRVELGDPVTTVQSAAHHAALVVTDVGYLRLQRQWRALLAETVPVPLVAVESEALVPIRTASTKQEYAARTLRPKLHRLWPEYVVPLDAQDLKHTTTDWAPGEAVDDPARLTARLPIDQTVGAGREAGGEQAALARLRAFVADVLETYHVRRNDPTQDGGSRLSAFLHYGHLSPLTVALAAQEHPGPGTDALMEELGVRRELSFNFCWYQPLYDAYEGVPNWARATLEAHQDDPRPALYDLATLEAGRTADPYWNAAQREMVQTGRMHNYLRMYWGKKLLEWSATAREAHSRMLVLNNRYEQDGRDANSFVGISWVLGLHDRPWARRPVYGMVRSMSASGLERKFDMDAYVRMWTGEG
ncbi:deoxyribodipyrimidine photo-lyase [Deinococcus metalli]|uniref:Deoxyribodipyrimidine photo-lyase n=1 Tax=Deinococcus metalli TaxID=1141878 RepID=A0A7W8KEA4_9DEIO|nr:deoxyribodipyrimidine photo-lyase [Deinococcus metalli]MBB5376556.1 deoxyribodipyrimidine photo-lyase [Deinococcus metalli]GHF43146.1 deoxyribodipyrimidine photo-lyase [Deinococcus metalli]